MDVDWPIDAQVQIGEGADFLAWYAVWAQDVAPDGELLFVGRLACRPGLW